MTNPLSDFTRLCEDLPKRNASPRDLRSARRNTDKFFLEVKDTSLKNIDATNDVSWYLSQKADEAALRVINESITLIQGTEEHKRNFKTLRDAPKNCGGFNDKTAVLANATPFEQMVALDHLINYKSPTWPKGQRTLCFKESDDSLIPIYIASTAKSRATTMTTRLGTGSRGRFKVPTYTELSTDAIQAASSPFIKPLEALEIVRQPYFASATLLKTNAFASEIIDHNRRFQLESSPGHPSPFACVELKNQNKPAQSPTKEKSAGCNIIALTKDRPKKSVVRSLRYENFSTDGYKDDVKITVSPS